MENVFLRCKCEKCGMDFIARDVSKKQYKIGDKFPHKNCGIAKVIMIKEIRDAEDCKEGESLYPSKQLYRNAKMTDKEIGKTAREIAERGNTAKIKKNKEGIVILEEKLKIVKSDKEW